MKLKHVDKLLYILMFGMIGFFVISSIVRYLDYRSNPVVYDTYNSAPWYTGIEIIGFITILVVAQISFILWILHRRKKG